MIIVFVAVYKQTMTWTLAGTILGVFSVLLVVGFVVYYKKRQQAESQGKAPSNGSEPNSE